MQDAKACAEFLVLSRRFHLAATELNGVTVGHKGDMENLIPWAGVL